MRSNLPSVINGRPFEPSLRALMEKFGRVKRGDTLTHEELCRTIGERDTNGRYRSVLSVFRRRLLDETGIWLKALPKVGYLAVDAPTQLSVSTAKWRAHARGIRRATVIAEHAPDAELNETARREKDHIVRFGEQFRRQILAEAHAINLRLGPPEVMPKPR